MSVRLRASRVADLAFITALERDAANRELIGQWSDAEHLAAIARAHAREHWIVERDGRPAGYLIAFDGRPHGSASIYVKRLLVADKDRGTGTAAMHAFLEAARARAGVAFVWLRVRVENHRAQAVYRKLGYAPYAPDEAAARELAYAEPAGWRSMLMRVDL